MVAAAAAIRAPGAELRAPFERPAPGGRPPVVSRLGTARVVLTTAAPAELVPDTVPPTRSAQLLWLGGRVAQRMHGGAVALNAAGGVVRFDLRLSPRPVAIESEGREWLSVAPGPRGTFWLTDATGGLEYADRDGRVLPGAPTGFHYATVASDPATGVPWVARSSQRFTYALDTMDAPLVARHANGDALAHTLGAASRPEHILLRDLANAGHVAVTARAVYFAPFIRDELIAFAPGGDTLWIARRGLEHGTTEPRFEVVNGRVTVNYSPVNLGLTIGPDDRVYLLSTPGRGATTTSRLDVFDPLTGALERSARLATALPTLAADASGRVYQLDEVALLAGTPSGARPAVPDVDVPGLDSGRVSLTAYRGRVVLINLWASWCAPCREEMPALDSLQRAFARTDSAFAFLSLADDVTPAAARAFMRDYNFDFRVGVGRGKLRDRLHAPGLPVTLLVDRNGREVRRWIGYAGPDQIAGIRAIVRAEMDRGPGRAVVGGDHAAHQHGK